MSWLFDAIPTGEVIELTEKEAEKLMTKEPKLLTEPTDWRVVIFSHTWPHYEARMEAIRKMYEMNLSMDPGWTLV